MKQRRGFAPAEILPLAIGVAIALIIVVSVAIPALNASLFNGTASVYTGTTATINSNVLPLVALVALVIVAAGILAVLRREI